MKTVPPGDTEQLVREGDKIFCDDDLNIKGILDGTTTMLFRTYIGQAGVRMWLIGVANGIAYGTVALKSCEKLESKGLIKKLQLGKELTTFFCDRLDKGYTMFAWHLENPQPASTSLRYTGCKRGKWKNLRSSQLLAPAVRPASTLWFPSSTMLPEPALSSTAHWFIDQMPLEDFEKLKATCQKHSGITVELGTTCSGCDVFVNVVQKTFEALSARFKAGSGSKERW